MSKPLSKSQQAVLLDLLAGPRRRDEFDPNTVASLMRRGLVEKAYQLHPDAHLDMVGWYVLKLTAKGRQTISPTALTPAQARLLKRIEDVGELNQQALTGTEIRVMRNLVAKDLVAEVWSPPQPGNDYGGRTIYRRK